LPSVRVDVDTEAFSREYGRLNAALKADVKAKLDYSPEFNRDLERIRAVLKAKHEKNIYGFEQDWEKVKVLLGASASVSVDMSANA